MAITQYWKGQQVRLTVTFRDLAGVLTNPLAVTFTLRKGETGTPVVKTLADLTFVSLGTYYLDVTLDEEGVWTVASKSTAGVITGVEKELYVRDSVLL